MDADVPGRLRVHVVGARGIEAAGAGGASDPYVRVSLLRLGEGQVPKADDARRTKTVYKTLEPVWDEHFVYEHVDRKSDSTLLLELFYQEYVSADRETSQIVLPVAALPARPGDTRGEPVDRPYEHTKNRDVSGALCLSPFFVDGEKTRLCVRVLRATDIKARHGRHVRRVRQSDAPGRCRWVDDRVSNEGGAQDGGAGGATTCFSVRPSTGKEIGAAAGGARRGVLGAVLDGVGERERAARAVGLDARAATRARARRRGRRLVGSCPNTFFPPSRATYSRRGRRRVQDGRQGARGGARARRHRHDQQSRRSRGRVRVRGERAFEFQTGIFAPGAERRWSDARAGPVRPRRGCSTRTISSVACRYRWSTSPRLRGWGDEPVDAAVVRRTRPSRARLWFGGTSRIPSRFPFRSLRRADGASARRVGRERKRKRERLHKETYGLHQELEAQLKMRS